MPSSSFTTAASTHNEPSWYGYLLIRSESDVALGDSYTLQLEDGRSGALRIDEISADSPGKLRAIFVGERPAALAKSALKLESATPRITFLL